MSAIDWLRATFGQGRRARDVANAYRAVFDTPDGRRVLADLAAYCNVNASSFTPGDPHRTAFNEGARDTFNHVVECAGLKPADVARELQGDPS